MDSLLAIRDQLFQSFQQMGLSVVESAPRVITGFLLVLFLFVVAKLVERLLRKVFDQIHLDALLSRIGLDKTLSEVGIQQRPGHVLARVAYYLLLFLFARAVVDALGIAVISSAMGTFLGYLPNLVAAIVILILGSAGGRVAARAVSSSAESAGIDYGASLGKVVSALILFISVIMAVGQLQVDTDIVRIVTVCLLAGLALGFGLSFGLGSREITSNILAGFYARQLFRLGEPIEIEGERGVLKSITPTMTLLDRDGEVVAVSNRKYLDNVIKQ
jgi:small-conductance mechanosensitive channel